MVKWKRIRTRLGILLVLILALGFLLLKAPVYYQLRSYAVMFAYSMYEKYDSVLNKNDIVFKIPGGSSTPEKDWFPFVMTFNDDEGFSAYMGRDLSFTVLYNFGAFRFGSSSSAFFDADSAYFNSFYGGYLIKDNQAGKIYGYTEDGKPDLDQILAVPQYDYKYLVMQSLGCPAEKLSMEVLSSEITENLSYLGYDGWVRIDSLMLVNSPEHRFKGDRRAYIQYGNPLMKDEYGEEFKLMTTHGRIYSRYFPEFDGTVYLYVMSPSLNTVEVCDEQILKKSIIAKK